MRVALFTDTFPPQINGVSMTLQRLTNHLKKRGIDYRVFAPEFPEQDNGEEEKVVRVRSLPLFFYPECRVAFPDLSEIERELDSFAPDLIHFTTPFPMGWCGRRYARSRRIPMVASHHTHFDKYLSYYRLSFCSSLLWQWLRWFHEPCHYVLVPSVETKKSLEKHGFSKVGLWKRGVDVQLFHPGKENPAFRRKYGIRERYLLLYVGRISPEKEVELLFDVMDRIPASLRNQIHWMFVGEGPSLPQLSMRKKERVTFTGYLQGDALAEAYASADGFIFPSRTETFGNVVLEAMASGTPVIAAGEGGVTEIVRHGETGWLCTPGSAESFAQAVTKLLSHPELWERMSLQAREYASTQSWEVHLDQLLLYYQRAILSGKVPAYASERSAIR